MTNCKHIESHVSELRFNPDDIIDWCRNCGAFRKRYAVTYKRDGLWLLPHLEKSRRGHKRNLYPI